MHDGLHSGDLPPSDLTIEENGVVFIVNVAEGQKTGFYHDQRDNRRAAARLAAGRTVLDAFCYTGGFGLHAAKAGAASVECVDVSEPALNLGRRNAERNGLLNVTFTRADVFRHLDALVNDGRRYGMVILDPPKFARNRSSIPEAMRGYRQLLKQSIKLVEQEGFVVFCCCSGLITAGHADGADRASRRRGTARRADRGTSRGGAGSPGCRELPGDGVSEVLRTESELNAAPRPPLQIRPADRPPS